MTGEKFDDTDNRQYAYFTLTGEFDPADISKQVGVEPSDSWRKGELHKRGYERRFSRWSLRSQLPDSADLEEHVRNVLAQMDAHEQGFVAITRDHVCWMELVGYFHAGYPGLSFDRAIVQGLAKYRLAVDFDFYGLYSHRRNDTEA